MSIASGFTKMKNYILTSSGYKLLSRWTSSQTVHMGDGTDDTDTVEYRFGAMKGVTSSLATDNDEFALSASAGKNLQDQCTQLNQSLMNNDLIKLKDLSASTTDTTLTDKLSNYEYIIICSYTGYNVYDFTIIPHKYLLDFPESIINVKDNAIKILSDKRVSFKKGSTLNAKIFGYKNII